MGPFEIDAHHARQYGIEPLPEPKAIERYLSPNQAGRLLNCTGEAVKQWIYRGRLPATKLSNGYYKIRASDLDAFIRARNDYSRKRVLVFCSNEKARAVLLAGIRAAGHEAIDTQNRMDATLKAADHKPSAFIIEADMPGGAGWQYLEKIRNSRHVRNAAVLMFSTGALSEAEEEKALKLRAQSFLRAPLEAADVEAELKRVLREILQ